MRPLDYATLMQTIKVFKPGNRAGRANPGALPLQRGRSGSVPAQWRVGAASKTETAADLFARIRAKHGQLDIQSSRGETEPVEPLELQAWHPATCWIPTS